MINPLHKKHFQLYEKEVGKGRTEEENLMGFIKDYKYFVTNYFKRAKQSCFCQLFTRTSHVCTKEPPKLIEYPDIITGIIFSNSGPAGPVRWALNCFCFKNKSEYCVFLRCGTRVEKHAIKNLF